MAVAVAVAVEVHRGGMDVTMVCPVLTAMSRMTDTAAGGAKTDANNPVPNNKHRAVRCDNNPECVACPGSVERIVIMVGCDVT